ncbi:uncharacterized protein LOC132841170 isoform X2 [Tachysurus vachellii]|uniref:uncharacterized protein LOC132841170 isoform X2 n=1 Tax=Tachysurus vachellii TaxID=175792 RepID=UPI00296AF2BF|nr:uncharacterized protein LOC132841170 isoform X2 [Tachysurus vachellii]
MGNMQYNQTMKYFTVALGCTLRHLGNIEQNFQEIIPALQNVQNPEDCDFIMAFCPVVAIKAAENMLNTLPDNKPAVLMVLHHTRDPEHIVPDSSRLVNRQNTITVDCLFHEDQGLLKCHKNNEALSKVVNWLHPKGDENPEKNNIHFEMQGGTPSKSPYHQPSGNQMLMPSRLTYFTLMTGNTLEHHVDIERKLQELIPGLQKVMKLEESDLALVFCPVVTRAGTDTEAAVEMLNTQAGDKPAVLVVLHHTRDPELIVPDSSRSVNRQNTITVDCLLNEVQGLLRCHKNNEALSKVGNWIEERTTRKSKNHQPSFIQMLKCPRLTYFTLMTGNTLRHHVDIERKLQKLIPGLQMVMKLEESDLVLVFCPVVSRAGTDTEAAVEMLNTQAGDKPAVLVVLHHTFDPERIVPDSSRSVNRQNTITVDCLFHEVQGFLMCHKNNEALSKVVNWIKEKTTRKSKNHQPSGNQMLNNTENIVPDSSRSANGQNTITADCLLNEEWELLTCHENNETLSKDVKFNEEKTTRKSKNHQPSFIQTLKRPRLTYVTLMSGKTLGRHVDIEKKLQELIPGLQMVMKLEESDFILIFCPVVTQAGTDIVEALKMLNTQAGDKPAVLVVLHHTFNPELFVPDSSRLVNRENTITVDCLFYEDQGLLTCHKNNEALSKVVNWLHPKGDENPEKNNILGNFRKKLPDWMPKVTDRKNWPNLMSKDTDRKRKHDE